MTIVGPVESIAPDQPTFQSTNQFVPIAIVARNPHDPVEIRVSTGGDLSETTVPVPVFNAGLTVIPSMSHISGFGFETVGVTVLAQGIPNMTGMTATMSLQGANGTFVPPGPLPLNPAGQATTVLRSSLTGTAIAVATLNNGTTAQSTPIVYTWPFDWIVFAIAGGLIGATIKQLSGEKRSWPGAIVVGVLVGLLSAALYSVGISVIPAIPIGIGGQLVVAIIAALGGLTGVSVLPIPGSRS